MNFSDWTHFRTNGTAYQKGSKTTVLYRPKKAEFYPRASHNRECLSDVAKDEEPSNIHCEVTYSGEDTYKIVLMLFYTVVARTSFIGFDDEGRWLIAIYPEESKESKEESD